jgi:hypothetical protein
MVLLTYSFQFDFKGFYIIKHNIVLLHPCNLELKPFKYNKKSVKNINLQIHKSYISWNDNFPNTTSQWIQWNIPQIN